MLSTHHRVAPAQALLCSGPCEEIQVRRRAVGKGGDVVFESGQSYWTHTKREWNPLEGCEGSTASHEWCREWTPENGEEDTRGKGRIGEPIAMV